MADEKPIELGAVRKRFAESAEALERIQDKLGQIAEAQRSSMAAARSLEGASDALQLTTGQLAAMMTQLETASGAAQAAVEAAEGFLQQTDLSEMNESIREFQEAVAEGGVQTVARLDDLVFGQELIAEAVQTIPEHIDKLESKVMDRFGQIEALLGAVSSAEERAAAAADRASEAEASAAASAQEMAALKAKIPPKVARKLAIDQ